jgi:hypothetical protein
MPDILISVSQIYEGGISNKHNVAVFITEGVRIFELNSIREALKLMDSDGISYTVFLHVPLSAYIGWRSCMRPITI